MSGRNDGSVRADTLVRLQASIGLGILAVSAGGLIAHVSGLPWNTPHQVVAAALAVATGWKALGR